MYTAYQLAYLYLLVRDGLISQGEAFAQVRADAGLLENIDLGVAADAVWEVARTNRNHGVVLASLLHEWASVHAPQSLKTTATTLVRAATEVLTVTDDAWLYQRATQAADVLADSGSALDHFYAGMLHLSAYALDPCNIEYSFNRQFRRDRMHRSQLPAGGPDVVMPEPDVALRRATHHLAETASRTSGQGRGLALAQLAFAEYSRHKAGEKADLPGVDAWCAEAARLLAVHSPPLASNRLFWLLCLRETYDLAYRRQVLIPRPDLMPDGLVNDVLAGSTAVRLLIYGGQRAAAGPVIEKVLPLLDGDPELEGHRRFLELGVVHCLPGDSSTCAQIEQGWTPAPADSAGLLHTLAHTDDDTNDELVATAVRSNTPHLSQVAHRLLAHRKVIRTRIELANGLVHALRPLAAATRELVLAGYPLWATYWFGILTELLTTRLSREDFATADPGFADDLFVLSDVAYSELSEPAWRMAIEALSSMLAQRVGNRTITADHALFLMSLLKGRAFSGAISNAGPISPAQDMRAALEMLAALSVEQDADENDDNVLRTSEAGDSEAMLGAYWQSSEREPGNTVAQQRTNQRRLVQRLDTSRLLQRACSAQFRTVADVRAALPADTALLVLTLGEVGATARDGFHALVVTSDDLFVMAAADPTVPARLSTWLTFTDEHKGGGSISYSRMGMAIAALRRALTDDPLHGVVTRAGRDQLVSMASDMMSELFAKLDEVAGSRERLVVWPHESTYFLPWHLLPFGDGILADRFAITTVPSLEPLFRTSGATGHDTLAVACAAGGLSMGLHEEQLLHEQASRIAALFGTTALLGDDATPRAVLDRMGSTRYLHIAAHGTHDVDAPMFAGLYLAGGVLHAHEILECDLRGVDLVTLSACESALLRYDFLDNIHGLAAAFLRAGTGAVVGALWPVEAQVAGTFFTVLHQSLAEGANPVDAFGEARAETRRHHPAFRDWGAFIYLGA